MITSPDNNQLKTLRKLRRKAERDATELFVAEGEDLVEAAAHGGWEPEILLRSAAGGVTPQGRTPHTDVEPALLDRVSSLGSGSRVIAAYRQRLGEPGGDVSIYLHGVGDPGNVGTILRAAHALADGPVVLGPDCADPFSPKAVRATMGSLFARPPARADSLDSLGGAVTVLALDGRADSALAEVAPSLGRPLVVCIGAEREGLPAEVLDRADARAAIPVRAGGPDSLNVAMAATVALYELARGTAGLPPRMPADA